MGPIKDRKQKSIYIYVYIHAYIHIYIYHSYTLHVYMIFTLTCICCVWLFTSAWTLAHQAPLSMGFSGREYWSELPCPIPGDFLTQRLKLSCRQFLYPCSHCGSPYVCTCVYISHVYVHTHIEFALSVL